MVLVATLVVVTLAWFVWLLLLLAPSLIVKAHEAKQALADQAPVAHGLLAELAVSAGIARPQLYVFSSPHPNGFVVASGHLQAIVVTDAIFERLNPEQLRGLFALLTACLARRAARAETAVVAIALALSPFLLPSLALARWALPGRRWHDIDGAAAALVGSHAVAETLAALDAASARARDIRVAAVSPLCCVAPAPSGSRLTRSFATHPPTRERIARVRRHAAIPATSPARRESPSWR
jgi:heat shock protein HtpX